ncbi:MAG: L-seryl-tRNA(Sec) selenium transferase, partial [Ruthenibacterium sp.]
TAPRTVVVDAVRTVLAQLRGSVLAGTATKVPAPDALARAVCEKAQQLAEMHLRPVVNGTGIVLHTNLGRAVLCSDAAQAVFETARSYTNTEFDLVTGARGSRHAHIEALLCRLTGAEGAMAVNNNAAAVLLMLSTAAKGREVVISRGELVEIGGAFRIPEVMEMSGCALREVGTTNKTRADDYERAVCEQTAALLKVHTSNFKIMGFTEETSLSELVATGARHGVPVLYDIGSGSLVKLSRFGLADEPTVQDSVAAGADITTFSGDKLLGGTQAGILVGKKDWIDRCRKNPLARALRVDKLTLAGLEATLKCYLDPEEALAKIPALRMLYTPAEELKKRAESLCKAISARTCACEAEVVPCDSQTGGGAVPTQLLPSWAAAITPYPCTVDELDARLRALPVPVVGYITHGRLLLDVRTILAHQADAAAFSVVHCLAP